MKLKEKTTNITNFFIDRQNYIRESSFMTALNLKLCKEVFTLNT